MKEKGLEEISLGELYEIVRKRRLLILGIIIASLLISAVYAFFLAVPVYKAEALLEVMDIDPGIESQNTAFKAENATNAYIRLLKTPQFINKLASELKAENINIDKAILSKVIAVKEEDDDESITLSAEYKEKAEVAAIVDASVAILCKEASMYAVTQIQREMTAVEERIKLGKAEYEKALTQYDKTSPGTETVSKLQSDLRVNEAILAQLKANLISGNVGYGSSKNQLEQYISQIEKEIVAMRERLIYEKHIGDIYTADMSSSLMVYNSLQEEYGRLKLAELYYQEKSNVYTLSKAVEPARASWPDRKLIILVSLVLGTGFAFLTAFIIEYFGIKR